MADEDVYAVAYVLQQFHRVSQVAGGVLEADDVRQVGQVLDDGARQVAVHHLGDVVEDDGQVHGGGDVVEVLVDPLVGRVEEVGSDDEGRRRARVLGVAGEGERLLGGRSATTGDNRLAARLLHADDDEPPLLLTGEVGELACRAAGDQPVHVRQTRADEAAVGFLVHLLRLPDEGSDEGGEDPLEPRKFDRHR